MRRDLVAARRGRPQALRRHGALRGRRRAARGRPPDLDSAEGRLGDQLSRLSLIAFRSSARIRSIRDSSTSSGVVLGVQVAAGERVEPAGREREHEPRRQLGRSPRRVVAGTRRRSSPCCTRPGLITNTGMRPARAGSRASRRSARPRPCSRCTRLTSSRAGTTAPLPVITILPPPRSSIPGITARQHEVDAEHVDLEDAPPARPGRSPRDVLPDGDAGVRDEQVDRAELGSAARPSARRPRASRRRHDRGAADLARDLLDLVARTRGHGHVPAGVRQLARDVRADAAPTSGDERDA